MSRTEEKENKSHLNRRRWLYNVFSSQWVRLSRTLKTKTPLFDRFLGRYITHTHLHTRIIPNRYVKRKNILLPTLQGREARGWIL